MDEGVCTADPGKHCSGRINHTVSIVRGCPEQDSPFFCWRRGLPRRYKSRAADREANDRTVDSMMAAAASSRSELSWADNT